MPGASEREVPEPDGRDYELSCGKLGLDGTQSIQAAEGEEIEAVEDEKMVVRAHVNQLVLTALDLNSETHDVHHPIDGSLYYEDQKVEAKRRAEYFRARRVPKFLKYFQAVLVSNPKKEGASSDTPHLISDATTTADLVLFHVINGLEFALPKRMAKLRESGEYDLVFKLHDCIKSEPPIDAYLKSSRRQAYSNGIFRHYPELDGDD